MQRWSRRVVQKRSQSAVCFEMLILAWNFIVFFRGVFCMVIDGGGKAGTCSQIGSLFFCSYFKKVLNKPTFIN